MNKNFSISEMCKISIFTSLMIVSSFIKIPTYPVAITFQLVFSILAGFILCKRSALLCQILFITIGLFGLPVFSEGGGLTYIFKPSFGFILGFMLCSFTVSLAMQFIKKTNFINLFLVSLLGLLCVYAAGLPYMYFILNYVLELPTNTIYVLKHGFLIFLPFDIIKCLLVSILYKNLINNLVR